MTEQLSLLTLKKLQLGFVYCSLMIGFRLCILGRGNKRRYWTCLSGHAMLVCPTADERGFPGSSAGKESACNAGNPCSIPGSGRSPGEGIGYPLQYSWASLMAQMVKNLPAMRETWVLSPSLIPGLGRSPGGGHGNPLQCSCLENSIVRGAWLATVHEVTQSRT